MPGPISQEKRGEIIAYFNTGLNPTEISRLCNVHRATVYRIVKKQEEEGHVRPGPYLGAQRCTTREEDESILNSIRLNGFQSSRKIKTDNALACSTTTIRRRLKENGYFHHIPAEKEFLQARHKEQRRGFCLEHSHWNEEDWNITIFSDEKVFHTDENGRVTLWRRKGQRYAEKNVRFRKRSWRITLGFWGCMSSRGPGPLVRTTPHMNSEEYIHILSNVMLPYIAETFSGIPYVNFIQDNSGVHRARVVQNWLATQPNLRTLDWPAKSPDLNVIENLWGIIVQNWDPQVQRNREALAQHVFDQWEGLRARPELFENLVASMPQRLNSVIENEGSVTRF